MIENKDSIGYGHNIAIDRFRAYNTEQDEYKKFNYLKDIIFICAELVPKSFIDKHLDSTGIEDNVKSQIYIFIVTRNLLAHFAWFASSQEIYIDYDIMCGDKKGWIYKFFTKEHGKIVYKFTYNEGDNFYCIATIPILTPGERVNFNDMFQVVNPEYKEDKNASLVLVAIIGLSLLQEYMLSLGIKLDKSL